FDAATGWLIGEPGRGLNAMFVMMNSARLHVALQGLGLLDAAWQKARTYAAERRQMRAPGSDSPPGVADLIDRHPAVRRLLDTQRAWIDGGRVLAYQTAIELDLARHHPDAGRRAAAERWCSLTTPVFKAAFTHQAFHGASECLQVFGGHGYIAEHGMEQFVRDARIAMIYEGANGVQAMDLVGRKLAQNGGRAIQAFFAIIDEECTAAKGNEALADFAGRLEKANGELKAATMWFMQNGMANPNNIGAGAHHYMHIMGIVALGSMWLMMAQAAQKALADGRGNKAFLEAKIVTARHFGERFFPDAGALRRKIEAGSEAMMSLTPDQFFAA
ncbi:MAG: acyl-CoA dehydrogenase C-terminal domain-containing protein, partial [Sphingopyxis sp.]|nr:acyl-CoA dehydrogenase C-terminal domain-containing protein [Sphingopyxis sp.]